MNRATVTIVLAAVLMVLVVGVAALLTFTGRPPASYVRTAAWRVQASQIQSMDILDLTGDDQDDLFVQTSTELHVYGPDGTPLLSRTFNAPLVTTLGDLSGNPAEEVVAVAREGANTVVTVLDGSDQVVWSQQLSNLVEPSRARAVRFAEGTQVVVGDNAGTLVALDRQGSEVWRAQLGSDYIRGLDDVSIAGQIFLVAASHDGRVALYGPDGRARWDYQLGQLLRRMRAYDLDGDGTGEVLLGGEQGRLVVLDAAEGDEAASSTLGQTVTEIREAELDGRPAEREFVVGGKDGGVWGMRRSGEELWSGSIGVRVQDIAALEGDSGGQQVLVGDESGNLVVLDGATGQRNATSGLDSAISGISVGRLGDNRLAVADTAGVEVGTLERRVAPIWYSPLLAGLLVALVIGVAAWFIANIPAKPALRVAIEDESAEGLQARWLMLHENVADVERLRRAGEMPPESYLIRLRELREELATTEAALRKAGATVQATTFRCPGCGGALPLGTDRCEYCGKVVIV